jgi:hypothetical protein
MTCTTAAAIEVLHLCQDDEHEIDSSMDFSDPINIHCQTRNAGRTSRVVIDHLDQHSGHSLTVDDCIGVAEVTLSLSYTFASHSEELVGKIEPALRFLNHDIVPRHSEFLQAAKNLLVRRRISLLRQFSAPSHV